MFKLTPEFIQSIPEEEWHESKEPIDWNLKYSDNGKIVRIEIKHVGEKTKYKYGYVVYTGDSYAGMNGFFRIKTDEFGDSAFEKRTQRKCCNQASTKAINITKTLKFSNIT